MLSIIVPVLNEARNVLVLHDEILEVMQVIGKEHEIIFIDDGSTDDTLETIKSLGGRHVRYISFSRNFGKESAIIAGLGKARGEAAVIMDGDLQHPPRMIAEMNAYFEAGYDQVIAKRNRSGEPLIKRIPANLFYRVMNSTSTVRLVDGEGDFRLISRKVIDAILLLSENNRFSKGIFEWVGFGKKVVEFNHVGRTNGKSRFHAFKLFDYAVDGISAYNHRPLRICFHLGLVVLLIPLAYILYIFVNILIYGVDEPGYFTIIASLLLLGSVQLFSLGIIGEYIGRIYIETKNRPNFIIREESDSGFREKDDLHETK